MDEPLFNDSTLPPELMERVRSELGDGERLLWVGQPRPGRSAKQALPIVLFGIPWTGFAIFWTVAASGMLFGGGPPQGNGIMGIFACFPLFGVPFILIGVAMLTAPFWAARKAKRTFYALTDRRAVIWDVGFFGGVEVRSYGPTELGKIRRVEYPNGEGDLIIEEVVTFGRDSDGHRTSSTRRHGFFAIPDVRSIEKLLRRALVEKPAE